MRIGLSLFALVCVSAVMQADTLYFKNGDLLTGELKGISGGNVSFATEFSTKLLIPQALLKAIETETSFELRFVDGTKSQKIDGQIDISGVIVARQHKSRVLQVTEGWKSRLDTGLQISTGNSSLENYNLSGESKNLDNRVETTITGRIAQEIAEGQVIKDQLALGLNTKLYYDEKWFGSLNLDSFRDPLKDIDLRISASLGIGHQFFEHTHSGLTAELGISRLFENHDMAADDQEFGLRWQVNYRKTIFGDRIEAYHVQTGVGLPSSEFIFTSTNGLKYLLSDTYDLNFRMELQHESDPAVGKKPTDIAYIAGLGISI